MLYDGFESAVVEEDATSEWFELTTGVKQGCTMSCLLFLLIIDWVMRHTVNEGTGLRSKFTSKLEVLDFADDVALISSTQRPVQFNTNRLAENTERTDVGKCKVMRVNARNNEAIQFNREGNVLAGRDIILPAFSLSSFVRVENALAGRDVIGFAAIFG